MFCFKYNLWLYVIAIASFITLKVMRGQAPDWPTPLEILSVQKMAYPPAADRAKVAGVVIVEVTVREDGTVARAVPLIGESVLAIPAKENVLKWTFKARGASLTHVVFEFSNSGLCISSCESSFIVKRHNHVLIQKPVRW